MSKIFSSILGTSFSLQTFLIIILFSVICGLIAALALSIKDKITKSFFASLVVLPAVVCAVVTMVNGNIGTGIAIAGAFSLVRFRSAQGKAKEITGIFLVMTAGIICSAGYVAIAVLFTVIISAVFVGITFLPFNDGRNMDLRIIVPESLNFENVFDEVLRNYTSSFELISVQTTDLGSLYKMTYRVKMKNGASTKALIDDLRCRNGNLEIRLSASQDNGESL